MNCEDVLPLLNLLSDSALDSRNTADIIEHLKDCSQCQSQWDSMLAVRRQIRRMKDDIQHPSGLMDRVGAAIDRESKQQSITRFGSTVNRKFIAIAAGIVLLALSTVYLLRQAEMAQPVPFRVTINAASLVPEEFGSDPAFELVADRQLLSQKLGYSLKYIKFADWKISEAGTYRAKNDLGRDQIIARFQFRRLSDGKDEKLYCYQAPAGSLSVPVKMVHENIVGGRKVFVGNKGALSFACWTQNERDYMLISSLSQKELEDLVSST